MKADANLRMNANTTNITIRNKDLLYPELSYLLTGICFDIQNTMGRFLREKQYADEFERKLIKLNIPYEREKNFPDKANILDFIIDNKIIIELKAKQFVIKQDYYQLQRYLQSTDIKLGLIINFRSRFLKPKRIIKIDTSTKSRYS